MKKFKTLSSVLLVFLMLVTIFAMPVSALTPTQDKVDLVVTKYQIPQMNGETDKIGNTVITGEKVNGINYDTLSDVTFTIFKLGALGTNVDDEDIKAIDASYNATNNTVQFDGKTIPVFASKVTGANGVATFTVNKDDFGVYFVKETNAPAEVTAKAMSFVVELPRTNAAGNGFMDTVYVYPKNYTTLGSAILQKVDSSQNNKPLAGAEFALYKKATVAGETDTLATDFKGNAIGTLVTDAYGYTYVNNLLPGTYYFKETKAPEGYILRNDHYEFTVTEGQSSSVVYNNDGTFTKTGTPAEKIADNSSQPQVDKFVTEINNKVDNVAFDQEILWIVLADVPSDMGSVYTEYKITDTMDAELDFVPGSVKVYTTTDSNPVEANWVAFNDFTATTPDANNQFTVNFTTSSLAGAKKVKVEYYTTLNEATTVMGDNIYNDVTLDYSTAATSGSDKLKVDKENNIDERPYVYTGGYKFKKTSINGTTVLEGAVFDVLNANGDVIAELTSDEYGIFEIKGLKNGAYSLVETKAPEGHELLTAPIEFTISKGSYDADITVVKNIPTSKLPLTGGMGTALFTCIGFVLIGMGAVLFFASRKKKSN